MFQTPAQRPICFLGDVVNDDGSVSRRQYVLLIDGRIRSVGASKPAGIARPDYTLADDELIFPSFLDLHTHSTYNMLPLWHSPFWAWDNRFQWRANAQYKQSIGGANHAITATSGDGTKTYAAINAFSELMAIAGGTTVLQESAALDGAGFPRKTHLLIRNTGNPADLGLSDTEQVVSVVDFYEPAPYSAPRDPHQDTSTWHVKPASKGSYDGSSYVADFALSVTGARTRGTIVHLAEGRSGFLQNVLGPDAYTRAEFDTFSRFISSSYRGADVRKVRDARLLLIHGCGMNTVSGGSARRSRGSSATGAIADTVSFLKTYGIGVIWSPVSNLLLYQDTTNVLPLLDAGVPVVLGTDWTPSGSKTVWEEAKFAADFLESRRWKGDVNLTCFRSITSVAADLLGLPLGRVRAGNFADLVIVRRPDGARRGDALHTFRKAGDEEVRAVVVAGVPLYGDPDVLKALGATPLPLPDERPSPVKPRMARVASSKAFALPAGCGLTLDDLTRALAAADRIVGRNRPRILVADDEDYRSRMAGLRAWVHEFGSKKIGPTPKPVPPPPTGLAPGELEWMYNPSLNPKNRLGADVVDLLGRIAPCRDARCAVPERHPFYHAEVLGQAGDSVRLPRSLHARRPCAHEQEAAVRHGGLSHREVHGAKHRRPARDHRQHRSDRGRQQRAAVVPGRRRGAASRRAASPPDLHRGDRRSDPRRRRAAGRERLARTAVVRRLQLRAPAEERVLRPHRRRLRAHAGLELFRRLQGAQRRVRRLPAGELPRARRRRREQAGVADEHDQVLPVPWRQRLLVPDARVDRRAGGAVGTRSCCRSGRSAASGSTRKYRSAIRSSC